MGTGERRAINGVRRAPAPSGDAGVPLGGEAGRSRRGWLIVFEGIDGAGKSEHAGRLAGWLRAQGREVVETREPTDGPWGRRYRAWARGETTAEPEEVLRFFVEDRREHVERQIGPELEAGRVVLCDRYNDSTLAYQAAQGLAADWLRDRLEPEHFPVPDLTLWLRLPVEQALKRLGGEARERFERKSFLERVDRAYERLGLTPLDASGSLEDVEKLIRARVKALFLPNR